MSSSKNDCFKDVSSVVKIVENTTFNITVGK